MDELRFGSPGRAEKRIKPSASLALSLAFLLALPVAAAQTNPLPPLGGQNPPMGGQNPQRPGRGTQIPDTDSPFGDDPLMLAKRQRLLNIDRQKAIVSDTNKLLKLAGELNDEVKNTNPEALTAAQLRKLADIEKLAHKVRENMSIPAQVGPVYQEPPLPSHR